MKNRIIMNSKSLKNKFSKIYENLFINSTLVVSAPRCFCWTESIADRYGFISLSQLLPLRTYVGIQKNILNTNHLICYKSFSPKYKKFVDDFFLNNHKREKIEKIIIPKIFDFTGKKISHSYNLYILSELPLKNIGASSSLLTSLVFAILLDLKYISNNEITNWPNKSIDNLKKDSKFDKIFRLIWSLRQILSDNLMPIGASTFASLINSNYPIIFSYRDVEKNIYDVLNKNPKKQNIDKMNYWGCRLNDLDNNYLDIVDWNIDFGLIDVGTYPSLDSGTLYIDETDKYLSGLKHFLKNKISKLIKLDNTKSCPYFWEITNYDEIKLYNNYLKIFNINTLDTINHFENVFRFGVDESKIIPLFKSINKYNKIIELINRESDEDSRIINDLILKYDSFDNKNNIGIKLACGTKGGLLMFAGIKRKISDFIENYINLNNNINYHLNYASWIDGIGTEGVKYEQNLDKNIISEFINQDIKKIIFYKLKEKHQKLIPNNKVDEFKKTFDLVIDLNSNFIFIKGRKLTSKDIHSSTTTTEILNQLLKNLDKDVPNKNLPESSYTFERGELQSKIVSPLVKAVKKYAQKDLDLKITGSLTNFSVKFNINNISLAIINKN